jgi:phenylalanyl-tRNA synthetase beta chain
MDIKILDSHLREFLKTNASAKEIAEKLTLTSLSVEKVEKWKEDYIYHAEVMTNRPDLASVIGFAREASAVLPQHGIEANFVAPAFEFPEDVKESIEMTIESDNALIHRICAVVMEIEIGEFPDYLKKRLEAADIRSLNNVIDITNYVMRTTGHPAHVFDYDRLPNHTIRIRESKKGEQVMTLDHKTHTLLGGDIVADDGTGTIVDLIGIMGLENSVVTESTKRILFFIDNNDVNKIRNTSMSLGIRTDAAQLNEKELDPELAKEALLYGISLYKELAHGKQLSNVIDIYLHPKKISPVTVSEEKIQQVIGVPITLSQSKEILENLGFEVLLQEKHIVVTPSSLRSKDIEIPEDVIEEIARIYGYHLIPNKLPSFDKQTIHNPEEDELFWESHIKHAMKYWGFTEVFTYSMVSENLYEGPLENAVTVANPLSVDMMYMRRTLVPSLLQVAAENKTADSFKIFEIANVYHKREKELPEEILTIAGVIKKTQLSFFEVKGLIEQLAKDLGIVSLTFTNTNDANEVEIYHQKIHLGNIEILSDNVINFEINAKQLIQSATRKKVYAPLSKYPQVIEDIAVIAPSEVVAADIVSLITKQNNLIRDITLIDKYQDSRTYRITYQSYEKNLTNEDIKPIREKIIASLKSELHAKIKE